jgi:hypothetical protein
MDFRALAEQLRGAASQLEQLADAFGLVSTGKAKRKGTGARKPMSEAARKKISDAQRKRWQEARKKS